MSTSNYVTYVPMWFKSQHRGCQHHELIPDSYRDIWFKKSTSKNT